jgi:hypothetical protein
LVQPHNEFVATDAGRLSGRFSVRQGPKQT